MINIFILIGAFFVSAFAFNFLINKSNKLLLSKIKKELIYIKDTKKQISGKIGDNLYFYCDNNKSEISVINLMTNKNIMRFRRIFCIDIIREKILGININEQYSRVSHYCVNWYSSIFCTVVINAINTIPQKIFGLDVKISNKNINIKFGQIASAKTIKSKCLNQQVFTDTIVELSKTSLLKSQFQQDIYKELFFNEFNQDDVYISSYKPDIIYIKATYALVNNVKCIIINTITDDLENFLSIF